VGGPPFAASKDGAPDLKGRTAGCPVRGDVRGEKKDREEPLCGERKRKREREEKNRGGPHTRR
jgi:hypothetical protein